MQKDVNAQRLTKMISDPVKKVTKKIYEDIQDRYFNNYNPDEDEEEEKEEEAQEVDEEKLNFVTDRVIEITSLKKDNNEFVKNLIPPLTIP